MTKQHETKKKAWYKTPSGIIGIIATGIFLVPIIIGVAFASLVSLGSTYERVELEKTEQQVSPEESYDIKIVDNTYASESQRRITFTVTNTGNTETEPQCSVKVETPDGFSPYSYGQDYVTWNTPLQPGERKYFEGLIDISRHGAAYATQTQISC